MSSDAALAKAISAEEENAGGAFPVRIEGVGVGAVDRVLRGLVRRRIPGKPLAHVDPAGSFLGGAVLQRLLYGINVAVKEQRKVRVYRVGNQRDHGLGRTRGGGGRGGDACFRVVEAELGKPLVHFNFCEGADLVGIVELLAASEAGHVAGRGLGCGGELLGRRGDGCAGSFGRRWGRRPR